MKTKELRLLNQTDMQTKIIELKKELMRINSQVAIGMSPKNPSKASEIKKTIAKILTIKKENSAKSGGIKKG